MDIIYIKSRIRQILSKLGAWIPWEKIERRGEAETGAEKKL